MPPAAQHLDDRAAPIPTLHLPHPAPHLAHSRRTIRSVLNSEPSARQDAEVSCPVPSPVLPRPRPPRHRAPAAAPLSPPGVDGGLVVQRAAVVRVSADHLRLRQGDVRAGESGT